MTRHTLLTLPKEIISLILSHLLPPSSQSPHPLAIYRALLPLCTLSRSWSSISQPLLFSTVLLSTPGAAIKFYKMTEEGNGMWMARGTKELRLECGNDVLSGSFLGRVLVRVPGLEVLRIRGGDEGRMELDPSILSWAVGLRTLHIQSLTLLVPKPSPADPYIYSWHFPHLTHLSLQCTIFLSHASAYLPFNLLLNLICLPKLETLDLCWDEEGTWPSFELLTGNLKGLALTRIKGDEDAERGAGENFSITPGLEKAIREINQCEALDYLSLDIVTIDELVPVLDLDGDGISVHLKFLGIELHEQYIGDTADLDDEICRIFSFPLSSPPPAALYLTPFEDESRTNLFKACKTKKVELVEGWSGEDWWMFVRKGLKEGQPEEEEEGRELEDLE